MADTDVTRVLHIVGRMDRGGVETWLMEVFRHVDPTRFSMDVLVESDRPGSYDDEARRLGVSIIPCASPREPLRYGRTLQEVLARGPGYDVVHSHVHHFSAYALALARRAGVPVRIAHSHSDTASVQRAASAPRRAYFALARRALRAVPTDRLGASVPAGRALFGPDWLSDEGDRVLHYGLDLDRFETVIDRAGIRRELGLAEDAFVIGHVGRFEKVKNHSFLVDIMAEVARKEPRAVLVLVGVGPLRQVIEERVAVRGLSDRVVFAGARSDVPDVMRAAMDVLVLPSLYEGLSIVGIEAQAAGLPCVFSDTVPREVTAVPESTAFLSLTERPSTWADALLRTRAGGTRPSRAGDLRGTSFDIHTCIDDLTDIYERHRSADRRRGCPGRAPTTSSSSSNTRYEGHTR